MKFNITAKLMAAFIVAILPFFIVTGFGHYSLLSISEDTSRLTNHIEEMSILNIITINIAQLEQPVHDYLSTGDSDLSIKYEKLYQKSLKNLNLLHDMEFLSRNEHDFYSDIDKNLDQFHLLNKKILSLKFPLKMGQAIKISREHDINANNIFSVMEKFQNYSRNKLQDVKQNAEKSQKLTYNLMMMSWVGSIVFSILIVFFISNTLSHTITAIDNAAKNIGSGNLDLRVDFKSDDELGNLVNTFNDMAEKLQETTVSKDYFDNIIQTMNDVLIVLTMDGVIQSVNETATRILGYDKTEMIGKRAEEVFPEEHPLRDDNLLKMIATGSVIQNEAVCISKGGKKIPMAFSVSKLHDEPGSTKGIVCVAQDISFQKKAEKDIKHLSQEMIRIKEEEQGRMSREIHDNLGGSLLALKINIHSILTTKGSVDESLKEEYNNLMDYLNSIIESSRNLSRNISPVGFKSVGLDRAITEMVNNLNKNKRIKILLNLSDITGFFHEDWDINIYRIVQEALTNILKHSEASAVEISAKSYNNKLTLQIKDNGKGIDFDKLRNLEAEETGLGLLIMRERTSLLGGEFEITSQDQKGTVIKVEIPRNKK